MLNRINAESSLNLPFPSVQLAEMNRVALLNRSEVKFVLSQNKLAAVLDRLGDRYAILEIEGRRTHGYRTLYFDTEDFAMYRRHHAGALNRYKVRARQYVESSAAFFEIKLKTNKRRTLKSRFLTPGLVTQLEGEPADFLAENCPYPVQQLVPRLWNTYTRFTLVNLDMAERVTVDLDLAFAWNGEEIALPGVVIVEVKQSGRPRASQFLDALRDEHVRRIGFSKFCIGVSLLYPQIKANRFKAKLGIIRKLMQEQNYELH